MTPPKLILASGSPQRRTLLDKAGFDFEVMVPDDSAENCGICTTGGPAALVTELAMRKAADVVGTIARDQYGARDQQLGPSLVIGCDTVAECDGAVLGKPRDEDHARDMLLRLRGRQQRVFSGLCLWPVGVLNDDRKPQTHLAVTELRMDSIADEDIEDYLISELWRGKAGGFGYQDRQGWLHILEGSATNVIGLPMELLTDQLASRGVLPR
ncbi:MAG: nucleoside triphosphate pyrophosphatase [Planctomycetota bacterium]